MPDRSYAMITVIFDDKKEEPLYEQLYMHIRHMIEEGSLKAGEKLPSKRAFSSHLQVSQVTVENAYNQLKAEGYINAVEKKGYYVQQVEFIPKVKSKVEWEVKHETQSSSDIKFDLKTNTVDTSNFPFSVWTRLMRECLNNEADSLLKPVHPQGDIELRNVIAKYLQEFRNMNISAEQIVLGAGSEYLLGLITEMLPEHVFAVEDPGYYKTSCILQSRKVNMYSIPMDEEGMCIDELRNTSATVVQVTPSHHFPIGTIMSINRRRQLLQWASQSDERYIIEDDYDSEYRFVLKPIPTLQSLDHNDKVIYLNTFAKTLAPSLRIGYMVLPKKLLLHYREQLMFYSCTVSEFEQRTLRAFIQGGYYERHLNRMRKIYKNRRDTFLQGLMPLSHMISISGEDAGMHILLQVNNGMSEAQLIESAKNKGVGVYALSNYYIGKVQDTKTVVVGYASFTPSELKKIASLLVEAWK
ncbi:PLP-dependent aminotransferase family protein [Clostridium argentinense]|nr:PLP-dependent aminotransferase family protein [Clostridium argentinense]NFP49339.1 PLP-dependent aminotransferase family protein [Clostridium argentinense]NFP71742.1 PLP-dependent aminotransferase family protein [Clostridium argentinense]NFP76624.1 PLP-dependent aminotransferase family protein [Clostridium argentinense]